MQSESNSVVNSRVSDGNFYSEGKNYWAQIPATIDGMLGGFEQVSSVDISASRRFLMPFLNGKRLCQTGHQQALDCGAGIGRITRYFLINIFDKVDLLEQNPAFLQEARKYLHSQSDKIGLQDFIPEPNKYDVIWVQWVLSHVPEKGVKNFLDQAKKALKEGGLLVIKENVCGGKEEERDEHDFTITRPAQRIRELVRKAGYVVTKEQKQNNFPAGLYEVRMFACRVAKETN